MKKTIISLSILFFAVFTAFGQSVEITPYLSSFQLKADANNYPFVMAYKSLGTAASPTAVTAGTTLLGLYAHGFNATNSGYNFNSNAAIEFKASQTYSNFNQGAEILFKTTSQNTNVFSEKMRIASNGRVGIGTDNPQSLLEVNTPNSSYGIQHTNGTATVGTYISDAGGGEIGTRSNHPFKLFSNNNSSTLTIETSGNTTITKFTKLGFEAPAIKQKLITGFITPLFEGLTTNIPHGLTASKILNVSIIVAAFDGNTGDLTGLHVPPNNAGLSENQYSYVVTFNNIEVALSATNSNNLRNSPIRVLITYME